MVRLVTLLRSLGNAGAVANAGALASARRREDWLVAALERRATGTRVRPAARRTA